MCKLSSSSPVWSCEFLHPVLLQLVEGAGAGLGCTWGAGEAPGGRALPGFVGVLQGGVQLLEALLQRVALVVLNQLLGRKERHLAVSATPCMSGRVMPQGGTKTHQQTFKLLGFRDVNPVVLLHHLDVLHLLIEPANSKGTQTNTATSSSPGWSSVSEEC